MVQSQRLKVPERKELFESFLSSCEIGDIDSAIKQLREEDLYAYNLVLRRMKLVDNLLQDDVFTYVNKGVGLFEEAALRLHLYLGCIEVIARLSGSSPYLDFGSWLNSKKEPYKSEREGVLKSCSGEEFLDMTKQLHEKYLALHGVKTHFYYFFHNCLEQDEKASLLEICWVLKKKPLPNIYDLQHINSSKVYKRNDLIEAAEGRKEWEELDPLTKLSNIANALYAIRNLYTHSLVPYTSVQDKVVATPQEQGFVNRGDTIFIFEKGIAISFAKNPTTESVRELIWAGLRNHYFNNYQNR